MHRDEASLDSPLAGIEEILPSFFLRQIHSNNWRREFPCVSLRKKWKKSLRPPQYEDEGWSPIANEVYRSAQVGTQFHV
jgi:hypothetical protein